MPVGSPNCLRKEGKAMPNPANITNAVVTLFLALMLTLMPSLMLLLTQYWPLEWGIACLNTQSR